MVAKTTEETRAAPKEVVISAQKAAVPEDILQKGQIFINKMVKKLTDQTEDYSTMMAARIEAGEATLPGGYQYWNCLTIGPVQLVGNPPYLPGKIVAAREWVLMLGLIWINPVNGPGGSLPGTVVLGGRPFSARFESINLSSVTDGPDETFSDVFSSLAPVVTPLAWYFQAPDPGASPNLYEVNLTADVDLPAQPFAAFSTWHLDLDAEPPFLNRPPVPPQWHHERPARFMIYRR